MGGAAMDEELRDLDAIQIASGPTTSVMDSATVRGGPGELDASRLVDLRGMVRPERFDGTDQGWLDWRFRFEAMLGLVGMSVELREAAEQQQPIKMADLEEAVAQKSRVLQNILIYMVGGRALTIVRATEDTNGFESWRKLVADYEPSAAGRRMTALLGVLSPVFTEANFREELMRWERDLHRYELLQKAALPDDLRCAIVLREAPKKYRSYLQTCSYAVQESYSQLKLALQTYWDRGRSFVLEGTGVVPMEVDVVKGAGRGGRRC